MYASISGLDSGIVGRDVQVEEVADLAESIVGDHDNGTEAPLPSRNDGVYKRSVLVVERIGRVDIVDVSLEVGCESFCIVAPEDRHSRVHVR